MLSPFPGVDPYLEQHWGDIHTRLMVYVCDQVDEQLPGDLQARVEESVMVDEEERSRTIYPDVRVIEQPDSQIGVKPSDATVAVAVPCIVPIPDEHPTQRHVEIVDTNSGNRVITAIELLSPANKTDEAGRRAYRKKQSEYIEGFVNLVEIDFVRAGEPIFAVAESVVPWDHRTPYRVCVRRAVRQSVAEIFRVPLREPVPNFRIPLRTHDPDVVLQLQPLLDECYRRGRYSTIDYAQPPRPALDKEDEAWADELLREKGLRG